MIILRKTDLLTRNWIPMLMEIKKHVFLKDGALDWHRIWPVASSFNINTTIILNFSPTYQFFQIQSHYVRRIQLYTI